MPKLATKVAVSLPEDLFRAVERVRRRSGRTRSAILQEALRHWLWRQREALLVGQYEAGYRAKPESRREIEAAAATAQDLFSSRDW
jgi:metal-responsive CopG/Arc/MetJ family transcriptional regulator